MVGSFDSLIPTPLHPAVVHLPIAFAVLVPLFAFGALIAVRRGAAPLRSWSLAVAMFLALSASAFVAKETGEDQEEKVERIVPKAAFETHEDAADAFFLLSLAVLGVSAVGLMRGKAGGPARVLASVGSLAMLVAGYRVGHSGGALVYTHGAASAYVQTPGASIPADRAATTGATGTSNRNADHDDDDR